LDKVGTLRVTVVTHHYDGSVGGVQMVAKELGVRYACAGFSVRWCATDLPGPIHERVAKIPLAYYSTVERISGLPLPIPSLRGLYELWRTISYSDFVHIHDCIYPTSIAASVMSRIRGVKYFVTQHVDSIPYKGLAGVAYSIASRVGSLIVHRGASRVFYCSEKAPKYWNLPEKCQWEIVRNCVDGQTFYRDSSDATQAARDAYCVPCGKPIALFVGRFVERKGISIIKRLIESRAHVFWIVVGDGEWGAPESGENYLIVRRAARDQLRVLYSAAGSLVLPSLGEGFPLVVLESLACGTPAVIHADTLKGMTSIEKFVESVGSLDTAAWAAALDRAFARSGPEYAEEAREHVLNNHDWGIAAKAYIAGMLDDFKVSTKNRPKE
jgi:glycosyltransferase involved in cell wall biosynthesis